MSGLRGSGGHVVGTAGLIETRWGWAVSFELADRSRRLIRRIGPLGLAGPAAADGFKGQDLIGLVSYGIPTNLSVPLFCCAV